jgi:hypothetical protein
MNAERELNEAYLDWRRLAESVGKCIEAGDWGQVAECQQAIRARQDRITELVPLVRDEGAKLGCDRTVKAATVNNTIMDLMSLVRRNQALLAMKKHAVCLKLDQVGLTVRNLRQIRRSYGGTRTACRTAFA